MCRSPIGRPSSFVRVEPGRAIRPRCADPRPGATETAFVTRHSSRKPSRMGRLPRAATKNWPCESNSVCPGSLPRAPPGDDVSKYRAFGRSPGPQGQYRHSTPGSGFQTGLGGTRRRTRWRRWRKRWGKWREPSARSRAAPAAPAHVGVSSVSRPCWAAWRTSSERVERCSFCMMWARCVSAVRTEM